MAVLDISDPDSFKWAGLASLVSDVVGEGLGMADTWGFSNPLSRHITGVNLSEMSNVFQNGNNEIYGDIYWQHLAYQRNAMTDIQRAFDEGRVSVNNPIVGLVREVDSPVPGDEMSFQDFDPDGDLASFDDRWRWTTERLIPEWQRFAAEPGSDDHIRRLITR
ncbi:MAG: DUF2515 family protein [Candidatus Competibacterales bacterium]